ncbi:XRE family transcriptional regulator [Streptomyces platensis]|uniref:Nucleoid-associated protein EspR n=1 Tax=Streptomyces platensis TaxID=58346 RepID=A0AAE6NE98_STRPT|nr:MULTISPECIES: helix-turn-helix domain-containing protein [Streptomyces]MCX4640475.1 helix-turn-helix domain-containing protein [Streptomyces platensis]OSY46291.1 Nucleoid-associated protein EspR [Streptomyces platensis]QEV50350.1 XRE family transcriptional regulator [Streptomyces platensis]WJY35903.1 helix-turn-helix domain-containing protein [Streptomyces sp. P9-2B-2]
MDKSSTPGDRSLADKLNHLFETVSPAGRGPYNSEEAARLLTASGVPISGSYIWLLRRGQRDNPTLRHLEALAKLFGVPPAYFFDDRVTAEVDAQLGLLTALHDSGVHSVALRAAGLSAESLESIREVIERVRELEGLPRDPDEARDRRSGSSAP